MPCCESITDFIRKNADLINGIQQQPINWKYNKGGTVQRVIQDILDYYPDINEYQCELSREDVVAYYTEDLLKGFIATLLWGGYHMGKYPNRAKVLFRRLSDNSDTLKDIIVSTLSRAKEYLLHGQIRDAVSLQSHIPGIGIIYWSKVLCFLYGSLGLNAFDGPVILDNVLSNLHCSLIIDSGEQNLYYSRSQNNLTVRGNMVRRYMNYLELMKKSAETCGIISPQQLEIAFYVEDPSNQPSPRNFATAYWQNRL